MTLITPNDRFAIFGARGMAGSAISRALDSRRLQPAAQTNPAGARSSRSCGVAAWFAEQQPDVVVLAAAKVGGIYANNTYPADFLLENLKPKLLASSSAKLFASSMALMPSA